MVSAREIAKVNDRAGLLANSVAEMLAVSNIFHSLVWVTYGDAFDMPLAVRTADNDGFGYNTYMNYHSYATLTNEAIRQARYSRLGAGRSAQSQFDKLTQTDRKSTSYSFRFKKNQQPGYAVDHSNLTVCTVAKNVDPMLLAKYGEEAINRIDKGQQPKLLEAGKWLQACSEMLLYGLTGKESGIAMIALPEYIEMVAKQIDGAPVIIGAQAVGKGVDTTKFDIVGAKAKGVARTRKPSGTILDKTMRDDHSNILGAMPAVIGEYGERILAVGGLDMHDDVKLIEAIASGALGAQLQITLLSEFAQK